MFFLLFKIHQSPYNDRERYDTHSSYMKVPSIDIFTYVLAIRLHDKNKPTVVLQNNAIIVSRILSLSLLNSFVLTWTSVVIRV